MRQRVLSGSCMPALNTKDKFEKPEFSLDERKKKGQREPDPVERLPLER